MWPQVTRKNRPPYGQPISVFLAERGDAPKKTAKSSIHAGFGPVGSAVVGGKIQGPELHRGRLCHQVRTTTTPSRSPTTYQLADDRLPQPIMTTTTC